MKTMPPNVVLQRLDLGFRVLPLITAADQERISDWITNRITSLRVVGIAFFSSRLPGAASMLVDVAPKVVG